MVDTTFAEAQLGPEGRSDISDDRHRGSNYPTERPATLFATMLPLAFTAAPLIPFLNRRRIGFPPFHDGRLVKPSLLSNEFGNANALQKARSIFIEHQPTACLPRR